MPDEKSPHAMTNEECLKEIGYQGKFSDYPNLTADELRETVRSRRHDAVEAPKRQEAQLQQYRQILRQGGTIASGHDEKVYLQAKLLEGVPAKGLSREAVARREIAKYERKRWFWNSWLGRLLDRSLKSDPESSWQDGSPLDEIKSIERAEKAGEKVPLTRKSKVG